MPRAFALVALAAAVASGALVGCTDSADSSADETLSAPPYFAVTGAYVRAAPSGGVSAAFFEIENPTASPDTLLAAATDVSDDVQIHQSTVSEDGLSRMERVERVPVPAGATVALEPGGYHLMLLDLQRDLVVGDSLLVELTFAERGALTTRVPVRPLGAE